MAQMPPLPKGTIPHLTIKGAIAAIEFYKKAFGAVEVSRAPADDGKRLMHAEVQINGSSVYMSDDFPEYCDGKSRSPQSLGGSPISLHLNVPNCDEAYKKAMAAGAETVMAPDDVFWGARYAQVKDPFGHTWAFMHPLPPK